MEGTRMRKLLTIFILLLLFSCEATEEKETLEGYWSFTFGESLEENGVAEFENSKSTWYYYGIGHVPLSFYTKDNNFYSYELFNNDTVINFKYEITFSGPDNFIINNSSSVGKFKRITSNKMNSIIQERESSIVKSEDDDIILIKESK